MSIVRQIRSALERSTASIPLSLRLLISPVIEESAEELAYWRLSKAGFEPAGIVDVGAYEGKWTEKVRGIFPNSEIVMVEAQEAKRPILEKIGRSNNARLALAALADKANRELTFYEMETGSSLLPEMSEIHRSQRTLVTRTLDEVANENLAGLDPLFIKIDVQGAELMVLQGGPRTLARTEIIQLEVPFVRYNAGAPELVPILSWLEERGFVAFDVAGTHRPDGLLTVQIDLLFARKESLLRRCYLTETAAT